MTDAEQQAEEHRLRRTTRHLILSLGAVAVFALAFLAIYWWNNDDDPGPTPSPAPSPSQVPSPAPQTQTLLLQATTSEGAVGNMLAGVPADVAKTVTLIPLRPDLMVSGPRTGPESLSRTVSGLDTLRPATSVAATLGVGVDASWRMDRKALAGLVDSVAGVPVRVTETLRVRDEDGLVVLRLRPGTQRLSGTSASWYAVGTVRGEDPAVTPERFRTVMTRTLRQLPDTDVAIRESLTALGALAPSTIGTQELANYLLDLSTAMRQGRSESVTLPVAGLSFAGASVCWLDYAGATPELRQHLPYAQWRTGVDGPARVLVMAPPDEPGVLTDVRVAITDAGLVFVDGRGTPSATRTRTEVVSRGDRALAKEVVTALGDPPALIEVVPSVPLAGTPWADADVALSTSYPGPEPT